MEESEKSNKQREKQNRDCGEESRFSKEFVLIAVKQSGYSLNFASKEIRSDKEVVLEAVKQCGHSLEFANEELRNDREIVLEAVRQNGKSLAYASMELQNDKEVILEAEKQENEELKKQVRNISFSDLHFEKFLGKWTFGSVYRCRIRGIRGVFVTKVFNVFDDPVLKWKEIFEREFLQQLLPYHRSVCCILSSPNLRLEVDARRLPDFKDNWKSSLEKSTVFKVPVLITKHYGMNLEKYVEIRKKCQVPFTNIELLTILRSLLNGIFHLRENYVVHRNLHPSSIFIDPGFGRAKIGDFRFALYVKDKMHEQNKFILHKDDVEFDEVFYSRYHSSVFVAPEVAKFTKEEEFLDFGKCDLFSCGMIMKYLIDSFPNFSVDGSLRELTNLLVNEDIKKRIGFEEALKMMEMFKEELEVPKDFVRVKSLCYHKRNINKSKKVTKILLKVDKIIPSKNSPYEIILLAEAENGCPSNMVKIRSRDWSLHYDFIFVNRRFFYYFIHCMESEKGYIININGRDEGKKKFMFIFVRPNEELKTELMLLLSDDMDELDFFLEKAYKGKWEGKEKIKTNTCMKDISQFFSKHVIGKDFIPYSFLVEKKKRIKNKQFINSSLFCKKMYEFMSSVGKKKFIIDTYLSEKHEECRKFLERKMIFQILMKAQEKVSRTKMMCDEVKDVVIRNSPSHLDFENYFGDENKYDGMNLVDKETMTDDFFGNINSETDLVLGDWKLNTVERVEDHSSVCHDFDFWNSPSGRRLVSCSVDRTIRIFDETGCIKVVKHDASILSVVVYKEKFLLSTDSKGKLTIWKLSIGVKKIRDVKVCENNSALVNLTKLDENTFCCCVVEGVSKGKLYKIVFMEDKWMNSLKVKELKLRNIKITLLLNRVMSNA